MSIRYSLIILAFANAAAWGQNTLHHSDDNSLYRKGLELLDKAEFAAARQTFEEYITVAEDEVKITNAEYYVAYSALNLYHGDGEKLFGDFIKENRHHPKAIAAYYELGSFYFAQKDYKKAIKYLSEVELSQVTPEQQVETRFKLGYAHFSQRSFDDALMYFNILKEQDHGYAAASGYYAGYINYIKADYDKAIADLEKAAKHEAYAQVVPSMIADIYYRQQRYADLIEYGEKVLAGKSNVQKDFYLVLADAYMNKGDYAKAAEYYDIYGKHVKEPSRDVWYRAGYVNYRLENNEKAINHLKYAASDRDSIGVYASYYLGILYLKTGNKIYALTAFNNSKNNKISRKLKEEGAYQYAKINYDLGRSEEAIEAFQEFTANFPSSPHVEEVNDLLSEAYLNSNDYNLAIRHLEGLRSMNQSMEKVYQKATYLKGAELFNRGDYRNAVSFFKKSLRHPVEPRYTALANLWAAEAYSIGSRYKDAIGHYQAVLGGSFGKNSEYGIQARYGLGYAYYNTKEYDKALTHFKAYVSQMENVNDRGNYEDALLRLADCYYVLKSYDNALAYYRKAIQHNKVDKDYAHLQLGLVKSILGDVKGARKEFYEVINTFSNSRYADDALFQSGQLSFENGRYKDAVEEFGRLIREKPSSPFTPYAYVRKATSHYNIKQYDQAIADYQAILNNFPTHQVAGEVLLPLQEVLNIKGKSAAFDKYLAIYKKANPDKTTIESVEFEAAKNQYFNQNYKKAIASFRGYIQSYPGNPKIPEAKYYLAESYYRSNEFEQALEVYNEMISEAKFAQLNRVINRVADIEYRSKRYENATYFYYRLAREANNKKEQYYGWAGLMESYFLQGKYDSTEYYARIILQKGNVNISSQNKASLYLGKAAYAKGNYEKAKDEFLNTLNTAKDEHGAEAQYMLGKIFYEQGQYPQSVEALIEVNTSFNIYTEWVGKAYLLLADNYIALDDIFQAKGTLRSIIENFPAEEVKQKARAKLAEIEAREAEEKKRQESQRDSLVIDIKDVEN